MTQNTRILEREQGKPKVNSKLVYILCPLSVILNVLYDYFISGLLLSWIIIILHVYTLIDYDLGGSILRFLIVITFGGIAITGNILLHIHVFKKILGKTAKVLLLCNMLIVLTPYFVFLITGVHMTLY